MYCSPLLVSIRSYVYSYSRSSSVSVASSTNASRSMPQNDRQRRPMYGESTFSNIHVLERAHEKRLRSPTASGFRTAAHHASRSTASSSASVGSSPSGAFAIMTSSATSARDRRKVGLSVVVDRPEPRRGVRRVADLRNGVDDCRRGFVGRFAPFHVETFGQQLAATVDVVEDVSERVGCDDPVGAALLDRVAASDAVTERVDD